MGKLCSATKLFNYRLISVKNYDLVPRNQCMKALDRPIDKLNRYNDLLMRSSGRIEKGCSNE